jgi:HD-GYP domain-containing protein (c-di-GMP phosphodiesterase class II)
MTQKIAIVPNSEDEARQRFLRYTDNKAEYFPIAKECLVTKSSITFNIYCLKNDAIELLYRSGASVPGIIEDSTTTLSAPLFIDAADITKYLTYLSEITKNHQQTSALGMVVMQERSKIVMKEVFERPSDSQNMKAVRELAQDMVTCILTRDQVLIELLMIKRTDFQVYVHSVNVAILSLALGRLLKLNEETLLHLGIGAFLHDIRKRFIPKAILSRQGRLNRAEFNIYKKHVLDGVRLLESTWKVPAPSIVAVSQHHEVLNGKGYPKGLKGIQIELFGRILGVANSFDNLTSPRPNKFAMSPFDALRVIVGERDRCDPKILSTFIEMLGCRR